MTEQDKIDKFKFQIVYLFPILASLVFGLGCASLLMRQSQSTVVPQSTPFSNNTPAAPLDNALYFLVIIAISAGVFYLLIKRRSKKIIKGLIVVAMTLASLLLSLVYLNALLAYFPSLDVLFVIIILSVAITGLFDLAIFRLGSIPRNVAVVGIGGALGIFFGFSISMYSGLWSAVLILVFLAVYDIFAVYRGPVGKIAQSSAGMEQLQGLSFAFKDIEMGLGDLVFYSMLTGAMFFSFNNSILPGLVSIVGIMAGSVITFFILEKKGIFPGLPFPIMLGLAGGLITGLVILPLL
ncbi:MAG: presenilin family intramembrane aspartyl protease [Candidatus Bathyarchaeia archaeon]